MATASELQHMQEHIRDSRIPGIIISSVVCGFVTCVCVSLRFLSRSVSRAGVGKDDYCIIMGLVSFRSSFLVKTSPGMWKESLTRDADLVPCLHHLTMHLHGVRNRTAYYRCDRSQDVDHCKTLILISALCS